MYESTPPPTCLDSKTTHLIDIYNKRNERTWFYYYYYYHNYYWTIPSALTPNEPLRARGPDDVPDGEIIYDRDYIVIYTSVLYNIIIMILIYTMVPLCFLWYCIKWRQKCNLGSIRANVRRTGNIATVFLDVKLTSTIIKRIEINFRRRVNNTSA